MFLVVLPGDKQSVSDSVIAVSWLAAGALTDSFQVTAEMSQFTPLHIYLQWFCLLVFLWSNGTIRHWFHVCDEGKRLSNTTVSTHLCLHLVLQKLDAPLGGRGFFVLTWQTSKTVICSSRGYHSLHKCASNSHLASAGRPFKLYDKPYYLLFFFFADVS